MLPARREMPLTYGMHAMPILARHPHGCLLREMSLIRVQVGRNILGLRVSLIITTVGEGTSTVLGDDGGSAGDLGGKEGHAGDLGDDGESMGDFGDEEGDVRGESSGEVGDLGDMDGDVDGDIGAEVNGDLGDC